MNETNMENKQAMEIDLQRMLNALLKKIWIVIAACAVGTAVAGIISLYFITPQYEAGVKFYVNNVGDIEVGDFTISNGDLVTSRGLVNSYIVILKTRETLTDAIDYAGVDRSVGELRSMISASSVDETEIFKVVVTSPDPQEAEKLANAIAYILPKRIASIIDGTSAKVVERAIVPTAPSSPNHITNMLIGFLLGLLASAGAIVVLEIVDVTIRAEEDITQACKHPILAAVPDMASPSKGGYYYAYGNKNKAGKSSHGTPEKQTVLVGPDISFSASEAYKLLRTKLQFSFAGENTCRVIGISSALSGEGKSLSAVNLAYSLSQLDKKVLLIDCDMRRPSIADKLPIVKSQGLSSYLSGQIRLEELLQKCSIPGDENAFAVISAGRTPPNPGELLSSERMIKMIERLRQNFDYVILDFPPVGEVSDAMAVAKQLDGILLVVRQNYCNRVVLSAAVRQFEFINSKILGVVYNCASEGGVGYGKRYYKRYYKDSYHGSYYASAAKQAAQNAEKHESEQ